MGKALFLDRDGTINLDYPYISSPRDLVLIPGAAEAIAQAQKAQYKIVVVSNQSAVGRKIISEKELEGIHTALDALIWKEAKAKIDYYSICPHHPKDNCDCRKPKPTLILQAAQSLSISLKESFLIGDSATDISAGILAACRSILVLSGKGKETKKLYTDQKNIKHMPHFIAADLSSAVDWILSN